MKRGPAHGSLAYVADTKPHAAMAFPVKRDMASEDQAQAKALAVEGLQLLLAQGKLADEDEDLVKEMLQES